MAIIKNLGFGKWGTPDENSDTPSDVRGGHHERSTHLSSNFGMLSEDWHRRKVLEELAELNKKVETAREETKNLPNRETFYINLNMLAAA